MKILDLQVKRGMEECKRRARAAGLEFQDNTLEYIVTNQDMLELSPKVMIPSLYDYWVHDIEVIQNKWMYDAFPHNPYETVINTRPPISFYNQDNADWFNVMIFYHVLGHIHLFQNNVFFRKTWDDDFYGSALADKRLINYIREELGAKKRWADYVIEFALAIDNLVGYHKELEEGDKQDKPEAFGFFSEKLDFYFGQFLKERYDEKSIEPKFYYDEIERYNRYVRERGEQEGERAFFEDNFFRSRFPELNETFRKWKEKQKPKPKDIFEHILEHSEFLNKEENRWMKDIIGVIRRTSLYFQPQIRTRVLHEGWASLWHERLYLADEKMSTHEIDYSRVNSWVTSIPRLGINPYASGKLLLEFIEGLARKGKLSREYQLLRGIEERKDYDKNFGEAYGKKALFEAGKYLNDYLLVNFLSDEDFQDFVDENKLWIAGVRPSQTLRWDIAEIYIKSKNGKEYRKRLNRMLYHPPSIDFVSQAKAKGGELYLDHAYEGRALYARHIRSVLVGLEFFWGKRVKLETTEYEEVRPDNWWEWWQQRFTPKYRKVRVLYSCENKNVTRTVLSKSPQQYDYD